MLRNFHLRAFTLFLLLAAFLSAACSQTAPAKTTLSPSAAKAASTQPSPAKSKWNPAILQGTQDGAAVSETDVPELYWHTQREAEAMLAQAHLQFKVMGEAEGPIVVSQEPPPGSRVQSGSTVIITLGQPQLLLSADPLKAAINTNINFTAKLEPPLPQKTPVGTDTIAAYNPPKLQANYTFYWDDNSQTGPTPQEKQPHSYTAPKTYNVFATAQVGNYQIKSNLVSITVPEPTPVTPPTPTTLSYAVNLQVSPHTVIVGNKVKATVETTPPPGPDAAYKFDWGDGTQDVRSSPTATHTYPPPARWRAVQATVTVAGHDFHSNAISVEVRTPTEPGQPEPPPPPFNPWPWIVGIVVGVGVLVGIYKLIRRGPKLPQRHLPQGISITGSRGQVRHEIRHAEQINKTPGIRFISGCTSAVSTTAQNGTTRKRSTLHA